MEEPRKPRGSRQEEQRPHIGPPVQIRIGGCKDYEVEKKQTKYLRVELLKEQGSYGEAE